MNTFLVWIIAVMFGIAMAAVIIVIDNDVDQSQEMAKIELHAKTCPELDNIITHTSNHTKLWGAKMAYEERCL